MELTVALDGETQGNDYQNTLADLQVNFAVQLNDTATPNQPSKNTSTWVKTGDDTNLVPYFIAAGAAAFCCWVWAHTVFRCARKIRRGKR